MFKEKGNLSGFEEVNVQPILSVPSSPAPSDAPAGESNHVESSPRPTPTKLNVPRRPEDFQSGFEPEYVPSTISKLQTDKCAKCLKKVFAIGKIEVDGRCVPWAVMGTDDWERSSFCAVCLSLAAWSFQSGRTLLGFSAASAFVCHASWCKKLWAP